MVAQLFNEYNRQGCENDGMMLSVGARWLWLVKRMVCKSIGPF